MVERRKGRKTHVVAKVELLPELGVFELALDLLRQPLVRDLLSLVDVPGHDVAKVAHQLARHGRRVPFVLLQSHSG